VSPEESLSWLDIAVELDGEEHEGKYLVKDGRTVIVMHRGRAKWTHVGGSSPVSIATLLLSELVRQPGSPDERSLEALP
jgi:hypothetical protein